MIEDLHYFYTSIAAMQRRSNHKLERGLDSYALLLLMVSISSVPQNAISQASTDRMGLNKTVSDQPIWPRLWQKPSANRE